ncbi:MAG: hydrolase [archaeon]
MSKIGILKREKTAFVLIDLQEKFEPVINEFEKIKKNAEILIKASEILNIPLIVTEQYPKGLGKTVLELPENQEVIEKISFSCFDCDSFSKKLEEIDTSIPAEIETLVLFGVEAHVCVLKTALDALALGKEVHVIADATSSRTAENTQIALERMRQSGCFIASTEMILFQLIKEAGNDEFKKISELVK